MVSMLPTTVRDVELGITTTLSFSHVTVPSGSSATVQVSVTVVPGETWPMVLLVITGVSVEGVARGGRGTREKGRRIEVRNVHYETS